MLVFSGVTQLVVCHQNTFHINDSPSLLEVVKPAHLCVELKIWGKKVHITHGPEHPCVKAEI